MVPEKFGEFWKSGTEVHTAVRSVPGFWLRVPKFVCLFWSPPPSATETCCEGQALRPSSEGFVAGDSSSVLANRADNVDRSWLGTGSSYSRSPVTEAPAAVAAAATEAMESVGVCS